MLCARHTRLSRQLIDTDQHGTSFLLDTNVTGSLHGDQFVLVNMVNGPHITAMAHYNDTNDYIVTDFVYIYIH